MLKNLTDGHILHPCSPAALRNPQASLPLPLREPTRRKGGLCTQNIIHVRTRLFFVLSHRADWFLLVDLWASSL